MSDNQLEISFLRKQDPQINKILSKSTYSAVYEFDEALGEMIKLKFEGSLYLLKRVTPPSYRILILNRKSRDDFVDELKPDTTFSQ